MRPALRHAALAAACLSALVLAGCGKHVASNAPVTWAPADTPYLFANLEAPPVDVNADWGRASDGATVARIQQLGQMAQQVNAKDPALGAVLNAIHDELANVHTNAQLQQAVGFSESGMFAIYGIGDVPVARITLASPDTFRAFWARVEKRAGVSAPVATIGKQSYWSVGGSAAKAHVLIAIEGQQLVATIAPTNASQDMLKQLLGLTKPANSAADRLARINGQYGYSDYGSGYLDLPRLFANLFDGKDAITQEFAKDLGDAALANPACAGEFAALTSQAPQASFGFQKYTAQEIQGSLDVELSPALVGALTALKQPVAGMDASSDNSMFDLVLALPLQKWQAFLQDRAKVAAEKAYQCPALQGLNRFAQTAANPPVQMPPEAASLLGVRLVLDKWEAGPQIAGRVLVASSNPAELVQKIQQTAPQFALKTIGTDGKPVAFDLPPRLQAMLGGGNQGWIAADTHALVAGLGDGEDAQLAGALNAPAGNGDRLARVHMDGKMYGILASWMSRIAALAPAQSQADIQRMVQNFQRAGRIVASSDGDVRLDARGLHFETVIRHR